MSKLIGIQITNRHKLLTLTIGTRQKENLSYENIWILLKSVPAYFLITTALEVILYLLYNKKVVLMI